MDKIQIDATVKAMRDIEQQTGDDPELLHIVLEEILLQSVPDEIRLEFKRIRESQSWWACA